MLKKICFYIVFNLFLCVSFAFFNYGKSDNTHHFEANQMTIDYHITIGKKLTSKEVVKIQKIIDTIFKEVDEIYNKWNPESEISKLNGLKAGESVKLSPQLNHFLQLTDKIVRLSNGKFDPTIEPIQQLWKSHLEKNLIPHRSDIERLLPAIGWKHIHFDDGLFYKDHDETCLDLGGIAKGYCVDLLVEELVKAGFPNLFVEWGGEARANGKHPDGRSWNVISSFSEDVNPEDVLIQVNLLNQAIASSGDYIQNWVVHLDGEEVTFFHIIDPVTAQALIVKPTSVSSATVVASTCMMADALATIAMMHPTLDDANQWAKELEENDPELKFFLFSYS